MQQEALKVIPSDRVARLFTIEVILDQTLENWNHFIKPIHNAKRLVTVK
jgi:hypothetical protein